jgi:hypothetical protein
MVASLQQQFFCFDADLLIKHLMSRPNEVFFVEDTILEVRTILPHAFCCEQQESANLV